MLTRIFPEGWKVDQSEELFITGNRATPCYNAHLEYQRSSSVSTTYRPTGIYKVQNSRSAPSCCSQYACFLPAPRYTKCCFVSHFLTYSIQSLSGQFLSWTVMYSESCSLQCSAEHALILSNPRILFLIKPLKLHLKINKQINKQINITIIKKESFKLEHIVVHYRLPPLHDSY